MKQFSLSKILIVLLLWGGELSNDSILVFLGYFFDRSSSLNYGYLFGGGTSRGADRERRKVHEGGAGCSHVSFLSALKALSFFKASLSFFRSELPRLFLGIDVHGIGVFGGSVPGRGGGVECDRSSG